MEAPDLTTLDGFKRTRGLENDTGVDDELLVTFIHAASNFISRRTGRHFVPYHATKFYDGRGHHLRENRTCLDLDEDLLALTAVTDDGNSVSLAGVLTENANFSPYWRLRLSDPDDRWGQAITPRCISIEGLWGFHEAYYMAWLPVTTLSGGIDDTITTFGVNSMVDLSRLAYIQIGDEIMQIVRLNNEDGYIEVKRGMRGSVAASALIGAVVSVFQPMPDIEHACKRLVSFYYDRRDTIGERVSFGANALVVEGAIPPEILYTIDARQRLSLMFM